MFKSRNILDSTLLERVAIQRSYGDRNILDVFFAPCRRSNNFINYVGFVFPTVLRKNRGETPEAAPAPPVVAE